MRDLPPSPAVATRSRRRAFFLRAHAAWTSGGGPKDPPRPVLTYIRYRTTMAAQSRDIEEGGAHGARASACDRRFRDGPRAVLSGCGVRAERPQGARLPLPRGGPHLLRLRPTMRPVQLRLLDEVRHRARRRPHRPRRPHQLVGVQQADHQLGDQVARGARSDRALLCGGQPAEQDRGVHGSGPFVRRALHRARPGCRAPRVLLARPAAILRVARAYTRALSAELERMEALPEEDGPTAGPGSPVSAHIDPGR